MIGGRRSVCQYNAYGAEERATDSAFPAGGVTKNVERDLRKPDARLRGYGCLNPRRYCEWAWSLSRPRGSTATLAPSVGLIHDEEP